MRTLAPGLAAAFLAEHDRVHADVLRLAVAMGLLGPGGMKAPVQRGRKSSSRALTSPGASSCIQ